MTDDFILEVIATIPQLKWQHEKKEIGLCITCGKNKIFYLSKSRCEVCLVRNASAQKKYAIAQGLNKQTRPLKGGKPTLLSKKTIEEISNHLNGESDDD